MAKLIIIEDRETVDLDPRGNIIRLRHIEYMLDNYGPYVFEYPKALWDSEGYQRFKEEVARRAREIKEWGETEL